MAGRRARHALVVSLDTRSSVAFVRVADVDKDAVDAVLPAQVNLALSDSEQGGRCGIMSTIDGVATDPPGASPCESLLAAVVTSTGPGLP